MNYKHYTEHYKLSNMNLYKKTGANSKMASSSCFASVVLHFCKKCDEAH